MALYYLLPLPGTLFPLIFCGWSYCNNVHNFRVTVSQRNWLDNLSNIATQSLTSLYSTSLPMNYHYLVIFFSYLPIHLSPRSHTQNCVSVSSLKDGTSCLVHCYISNTEKCLEHIKCLWILTEEIVIRNEMPV